MDYSDFSNIPGRWPVKTIKDIALVKGGKRMPVGSALVSPRTSHPYIRIVDLIDGNVDKNNLLFVPEDVYPKISRYIVNTGDIYISIVGTIGLIGVIDESLNGANLTENAAKITSIDKSVDHQYLKYYLLSGYGQFQILSRTVGSTQPKLALSRINDIQIFLPPLQEQHAIADVLSALDDKIELNRRMNQTLEELSQTIFRHMFIENPEREEWKEANLPEVFDINSFRPLKKDNIAPYVDMVNLPMHGHRVIKWIERKYTSGMRFINGDTLLARITPCLENGKTAFVDFLDDEQIGWGSTEFITFHPQNPIPAEFGYYLARSRDFRDFAIQNMSGTSGRQRVPSSCFKNYKIKIPPEKYLLEFGILANDFMKLIRENDNQSRTLAELRDTLLPKLLSGQVRVAY